MKTIPEKYSEKISFVLSCFDRMILSGTLPTISHPAAMTSFLYQNGVRIFDYARFAEPYKEKIRENAERLAKENGIEIEFIRKSNTRKEDLIAEKIKSRGSHPGLVAILSAMETCPTYKPWHDISKGKTYLRPDTNKCLHYYFYLIDEVLGLIYVRVPTWCPFRLLVYVNGHSILARELDKEGIGYTMLDNAFDSIEDPEKAQQLANDIDIKKIHRRLEMLSWMFCPVYKEFKSQYHWTIHQAECSTDIVFKKQTDLNAIYPDLVMTAIHTVKPDNIATFLGRRLDARYQGEIGNNYSVRIEGSRIKHSMGNASIKMYDKFSKILRIETTTNDVTLFKHYREVVHRDGKTSNEITYLKKSIYSLSMLGECLRSANKRYIEFISAFDNNEVGRKKLEKISLSKTVKERNYKGFNLFDSDDTSILLAILRGEFNISGFRNKDLKSLLNKSSSQISRLVKRLRVHGLIKKVSNSYKYYVTSFGKATLILAFKLKNLFVIPELSF